MSSHGMKKASRKKKPETQRAEPAPMTRAGRRRAARADARARRKVARRLPGNRSPIEYLAAGAIAVLALMHLASAVSEFRPAAGLHRWFMTWAEGYHRRGLVGTIFQALVGDWPRSEQIALASQISAGATYLWLVAGIAVLWHAAGRVADRGLRQAALAFAAFAFINPMWTTRAYDNGYLDWLAGLCVLAAAAAFAFRRPLLSGAVAAVGIVAYWGTVFVWLPVGILAGLRLASGALAGGGPAWPRLLAAGARREALALWLPLAAAALSALFNDNAAAVAELERIGGQENIIRETFFALGPRLALQLQDLVSSWKTYAAAALVFAVPSALCAGLLAGMLRRCGLRLFGPAWLDVGAAVAATLAPLSFFVVGFDLTRMMGWTFFAFFAVAVFYLTRSERSARRKLSRTIVSFEAGRKSPAWLAKHVTLAPSKARCSPRPIRREGMAMSFSVTMGIPVQSSVGTFRSPAADPATRAGNKLRFRFLTRYRAVNMMAAPGGQLICRISSLTNTQFPPARLCIR